MSYQAVGVHWTRGTSMDSKRTILCVQHHVIPSGVGGQGRPGERQGTPVVPISRASANSSTSQPGTHLMFLSSSMSNQGSRLHSETTHCCIFVLWKDVKHCCFSLHFFNAMAPKRVFAEKGIISPFSKATEMLAPAFSQPLSFFTFVMFCVPIGYRWYQSLWREGARGDRSDSAPIIFQLLLSRTFPHFQLIIFSSNWPLCFYGIFH